VMDKKEKGKTGVRRLRPARIAKRIAARSWMRMGESVGWLAHVTPSLLMTVITM